MIGGHVLVRVGAVELTPDQFIAPVGDEGLLGAFLFEPQPVGAALVELLGGEGEDGVGVDQQQQERQQGPDRGPGPHQCAPALLGFLERAWADWRAARGPRVLIPDTFPLPGLGRGTARDPDGGVGRPGWFCFDTATPLVAGSWPAAVAAADAALTGADLLAEGAPAAYALCRPPGHHAGPGYYGGFCLLNNAAVAARALRRLGRVAVVDVDFHHGNGTQDVFWEDPALDPPARNCYCRAGGGRRQAALPSRRKPDRTAGVRCSRPGSASAAVTVPGSSGRLQLATSSGTSMWIAISSRFSS
jgi:hypothetical protein